MRVVVEDDVFAAPEHALHLYSLLALALDGRHHLVVDRAGSGFSAWYQQRSRADQEACDLVLDAGLEAETRGTSRRSIMIVRGATDWEGDPPRATLADALVLLNKPFSVLLENWKSDFAFLLAMAKPEQRSFLERMKHKKWLHAENGGGLQDMERRVQELKTDPVERLTLWVLFDSDARRRGAPSPASKKLHVACGKRVPFHQLERRTIESYVTRAALEAWGARWSMDDRVSAFYEMPEDDQRYFFNMKGGFQKDQKDVNSGVAEDLYGPPRLDPAIRARLTQGFGSNLRNVFADGSVTVADLVAEGAFAEVNAAVTALLGWLR
jgi:hypothetical protein